MSEQTSDKALVLRVQAGDKAAFDLLVRKYQQRVINLVSRFVRDHSEVQDVAQEAFLKAYRAIDKFRGDSAFYTWLYRISVNTAKNFLIAKGRRTPEHGIDPNDAEHFDGESRLKDIETPENLILTEEIKKMVFSAIEQLPEDLKSAITLRELEGLSYDEIADVMDCPIGTVRSRIFRAREAIDKVLSPLLN